MKKSSNKKSPINLISDAMLKHYQIGKPECCPIERSGIQLEWDNRIIRDKDDQEERHLEIEIPEYNFLCDNYDETFISGKIKAGDKELVDNLFKWLNFKIDKI
jgi:hypothetical protein